MSQTHITLTSAEVLLDAAREVLRAVAAEFGSVGEQLGDSVVKGIQQIYGRTAEGVSGSGGEASALPPGSVVVSGVGKSGLVGQRISASFASTGTPSHFLHPVEAVHGDLGRVRRNDIALLLSYSGETDEVVRLLDFLKRQLIPVIVIVSSKQSTLGKLADIAIELGPIEEVCPHGLAPTTSVNCISAVGDALGAGGDVAAAIFEGGFCGVSSGRVAGAAVDEGASGDGVQGGGEFRGVAGDFDGARDSGSGSFIGAARGGGGAGG